MGLLTGVARGLLDLIYPPECWMCAKEILPTDAAVPLCPDCQGELWLLPQERCPKCGKINLRRAPTSAPCRECRSGARRFDSAVSIYIYGGTFRKIWHHVKFSNHPDWIPAIVDSALEKIGPDDAFNPYLFDVYTWVPTTDRRKAQRGFDPAQEIARCMSEKYKRPLMELLYRIRDARPQFELTRKERITNVEGAFSANLPRDLRTRAALLVDDILTTGATASACAEALKSRGMQKVVLFTLARGA